MKKRIIFAVNTVMTLVSAVYYSTKLREADDSIITVLIWKNPTHYNIQAKKFLAYFNNVYDIPQEYSFNKIMSMDMVKGYILSRRYIHETGIEKMLKEKYDRDILAFGSDGNGFVSVVIKAFSEKWGNKKFVLFEEGMALYSEKRYTFMDIMAYNFGKKEYMQPVIGAGNYIDVIFAGRPLDLPKWKRKSRKIIKQSDVFSEKKIWEKMLENDINIRRIKEKTEGKNVLLYLGQPINEFSDKFKLKHELELIHYIVDCLSDEYRVLIKGHPRDSISKYKSLSAIEKCVLFDKNTGWYPMECLLGEFDICQVVSFSSSAALNILERLPKAIVIYTYEYFNIQIPGNWDSMYRKYNDTVKIPTNLNEIKKILEEKPKKRKLSNKVNNCRDISYLLNYFNEK